MSTIEQAPVSVPVERPLTIEERVQNGIAFLDEHVLGWRKRVPLDELEMCGACVLYHVGGDEDFWATARRLGLSEKQAEGLGFYVLRAYEGRGLTANYKPLQDAWERALA